MRLTSEFYVAALVRRVHGAGAYALVRQRGAQEAGAVFIIVDRLDGSGDLHVPAAQAVFDDDLERRFERVLEGALLSDIDARLEKEMRFDPDLWVVVIEDGRGRAWV